MSGIHKEPQYSASRSSYASSDKRYTPYNHSKPSRNGNGNGSRSSGCFKCGEDGHFSRECPQNKSTNNSRSSACYKCGESGHFSRECPQNKRQSASSSSLHSSSEGCFKCGEPGHFSRECPNRRKPSGASSSMSSIGRPSSNFGIKFGQAGAGLTAVDWANIKLLPFQRDFYKESTNTSEQSTQSIDEWKKQHDIECFHGYHDSLKNNKNGNNWNKKWTNDDAAKTTAKSEPKPIPNPIMSFTDASFPTIITSAIEKAGFTSPTPIQSATWPMVLAGNDVIGIARTGSGKTLAFLLPAIVHIKAQPPVRYGDGPIAVIIAPTRELACQIEGEVHKFACNTRHCCVYGGAKKWDQKRKLRQGVDIVIATPGRLLDFLESGVTNFKRVTYAVIDEADRLLDMGFEPQLNAIMNQIRPDRQMMMFSATWPKEVRSLAKKYMVPSGDDSNVFQVAIGSMDKLRANQDVLQKIEFMDKSDKIRKLKERIDEFVKEDKESKILVFISTKKMCNSMQQILWEDGYWVTCIHGDKEQKQRDRALGDFKSGKMKIMLATDVASRGIHVDDIKLVINFDFPTAIEDYVHRIGRTGRAGNKGTAISFFVEDTDGYRAKDLIKVLKDAKQEVPEQLLKFRNSSRGYRDYGRRRNNYRNNYGRRW